MGWLKRAVKAVVRVVKAVVRVAVRIVATFVGLALGAPDVLLGFLKWPPKRLRVQIFILSSETGRVVAPADPGLATAIDFARKTFKDRFNVKLLPYGKPMTEVIQEPAP